MKRQAPVVKILIAYHKNTHIFKSKVLTPIHVGRSISDEKIKNDLSEIIGDDTGDNISIENPHYCELTAMYWAWKNYEELGNPDYIGLAHYRRFLKFEDVLLHNKNRIEDYQMLMDDQKIVNSCRSYELIIPNKNPIQNSKFEPMKNLYEQYKSDHFIEDLDLVETIIKRKFTKIYSSYKKTIYENDFVYWCNMFILSKKKYLEYCNFLFPILKEVKDKINFKDKKYDKYQSRVLGFLSERLLNVYIQYLRDKDLSIKILELPVFNVDEYFLDNGCKKNISNVKQIFSFDVFDTLITRVTGDSVGAFSYMENLLKKENNLNIPDVLVENFSFLRQESETLVRNSWRQCYSDNPSKRDEQDITIDDIYDRIQDFYRLSNKQTQFLKKLELECEQKIIIPINKNIKKIENLCEDETKRVILISDTYLLSKQIKKILEDINPIFKKITIYTSSEVKRTKYTGDLYKYIRDKENINFSNWIHTGDNTHSDVTMAKKYGIEAIHFDYPKLLDWEKRLLNFRTHHDFSAQIITGLEKNHRLFFSKSEKSTFGGSFVAPLFIGYIEFILEEAKKNNLKSLFFLARDGYILKKMTDVIIKERKIPIKTFYLYSSRKAWRNPSIIDDFPKSFFTNQWLFDTENIRCSHDLSKFFGISWNLLKQFLPDKYKSKDFLINDKNIDTLSKYLKNNEDFKLFFLKNNKKKRLMVKKYFKQEINFNEKFGIIDFYGLGLTQNCFNKIIKDMNFDAKYLYFTFKNESSLFNNEHTRQYQAFGHCFWILEPLLRAPHGQTLGYEENSGIIEPILEKSESDGIIKWGLEEYAKGMTDFVKEYEEIRKKIDVKINFIDIFLTHYESIWSDGFIVEMIGSIPFDIRVGETLGNEFAPKININQAIKYVFTGKYPKNLIWLNGSLTRSGKLIKKILPLRRFVNGENKVFRPIKKLIKKNILFAK